MKLGPFRVRSRRTAVFAGTTAIALVAGIIGATVASGNPQADGKTVSYLGLNFTVPASWPVIDVSPSSTTCVRFDRHAVYLGTPGVNQDCPAGLIGSSEALLVQPATSGSTTATDDTVSREITVTTPSVSITAGYSTDRAAIVNALASAGLPTPTPVTPTPSAVRAHAATATAAVPAAATNFTGKAFDACQAPSQATMTAWRASSPYQAVGVYIGGADMGCKTQTNLDAAWVATQYNAGWRFLPTYVGPQATWNQITSGYTQGTQAADDAVVQAQRLGFGAGNVLYYDMEGYAAQYRGEAMSFESAWTAELHRRGYLAGVYSSKNSGMADLAGAYGGLVTPDVVWSAAWNGKADTASADTGIPDADWTNHQKAHQYASPVNGETYGGMYVGTDDDYMDVGIAGTAIPAGRSAYQNATPQRLLDTRNGIGAPQAAVGAGRSVTLTLTGLPSSVTSVVLNVTAVTPTAGGYVAVYPDGAPRPNTSSINFGPGVTIANLVTVPVYDGAVDFFNYDGSVQILADLVGYYTTTQQSEYHEFAPQRLLDTRKGIGVPQGALGGDQTLDLTVGGVDGIPADVTAVIMNITAVNPSDGGYLTAYAGGTTRPVVSNLNFAAGQTVPNLAIVPVNNGVVTIYNHSGTVDVVGDVTGFFTAGTKYQFTPVNPARLLDTRTGAGTGGRKAPIGTNGTVRLAVAGNDGVPAGVEAVVLNVTAIGPTSSGYLTVYPDGQARPTVSNLNYTSGETIANQVMVPVVNGYVDFYNLVGNVNVAADLAGYFTG